MKVVIFDGAHNGKHSFGWLYGIDDSKHSKIAQTEDDPEHSTSLMKGYTQISLLWLLYPR